MIYGWTVLLAYGKDNVLLISEQLIVSGLSQS